jgi:hypothetical protein
MHLFGRRLSIVVPRLSGGGAVASAFPYLEAAVARLAGVRRHLAAARAGGASRARRPREGARDPRPATRAVDPAPAGRQSALRGARSAPTCRAEPRAAAPLLGGLPGAAGNAAALASATRCPSVDLRAAVSRPAADRERAARPDPPARNARTPAGATSASVGSCASSASRSRRRRCATCSHAPACHQRPYMGGAGGSRVGVERFGCGGRLRCELGGPALHGRSWWRRRRSDGGCGGSFQTGATRSWPSCRALCRSAPHALPSLGPVLASGSV